MYLDMADAKLGHFIRTGILLGILIGAIVGTGAYLIGVPFALLLGVIVAVFEFVPMIGSYISGAIGILFAFTAGWQTGVIMILFTIAAQGVLDGQILMPRIMGKSVDLRRALRLPGHPADLACRRHRADADGVGLEDVAGAAPRAVSRGARYSCGGQLGLRCRAGTRRNQHSQPINGRRRAGGRHATEQP
jgi:hypothetical protein